MGNSNSVQLPKQRLPTSTDIEQAGKVSPSLVSQFFGSEGGIPASAGLQIYGAEFARIYNGSCAGYNAEWEMCVKHATDPVSKKPALPASMSTWYGECGLEFEQHMQCGWRAVRAMDSACAAQFDQVLEVGRRQGSGGDALRSDEGKIDDLRRCLQRSVQSVSIDNEGAIQKHERRKGLFLMGAGSMF